VSDTTVTEAAPDESPDEPVVRAKRPHVALGVCVAVGVVVAFLVVVLATSPSSTDRITKSPLVGKPAPAIVTKTIDGQAFDLSRYEGEWVLVNFFGTWCTPCRQEHPELRKFAAEHEAAGDGTVVSVVVNDDVSTVKRYFEEQGGDWPVVTDPDASILLNYGNVKVPESYLVSPDGIIAAKISGGISAAGVDKVIAEIDAAGSSPSPTTVP